MRRVTKSSAPVSLATIAAKVGELCDASQEVTEEIADGYTITLPTPFTPVRTLDLTTTLTANDVAAVLATFLQDMKNRGINRKASNV